MPSKKSLASAAATSGMFTKVEPQEMPEPPKGQDASTNVKTEQPDEKKRETATFSVKIDKDVLKRWRTYAGIDGYGDKGKLTEAALTEYMNRHKLTGEKKAKFDVLMGL